jgi:hypothetical protein
MDTVMIKDNKRLDSYWDLEIQETLLDVAAAIAATELAGSSAPLAYPRLNLGWWLIGSCADPQR